MRDSNIMNIHHQDKKCKTQLREEINFVTSLVSKRESFSNGLIIKVRARAQKDALVLHLIFIYSLNPNSILVNVKDLCMYRSSWGSSKIILLQLLFLNS